MNPTVIALGVASAITLGLVAHVVALSFLLSLIGRYLCKPRFEMLKSKWGENGLALAFYGPSGNQAPKVDQIRIRSFNPKATNSKESQIELVQVFSPFKGDGAFDLDFSATGLVQKLLKSENFSNAIVQLEILSRSDGESFSYEMTGSKFQHLFSKSKKSLEDFEKNQQEKEEKIQKSTNALSFGGVEKQTVADTVPGLGPKLKIVTNPEYAQELNAAQGNGNSSATGAGQAQSQEPNFSVSKVWIAEGCIVCNACEDIYPEVFHVQANTCIIRPNPPLDNGLKILEAANACPVEVIKYTKA